MGWGECDADIRVTQLFRHNKQIVLICINILYAIWQTSQKTARQTKEREAKRGGVGGGRQGSWLQTTPPQRVASRCVYIYLTFKRFAQTVVRPKPVAEAKAEGERRKLRQRDSGNTLHYTALSAEFVQAACSDIMRDFRHNNNKNNNSNYNNAKSLGHKTADN